jgi:hypothetical protein
MAHVVRDARGTQQANKGRSVVMFGAAPAHDSAIARLTGEARDAALRAHAVDLCVRVQGAVEQVEGRDSDPAIHRRHYERVIDCVTEFQSASVVGRGSEGQTQRNLVVTFVGQNLKSSFMALNNRLRRAQANVGAARPSAGQGDPQASSRPAVSPLHIVHDLDPKECQAFSALQAYTGASYSSRGSTHRWGPIGASRPCTSFCRAQTMPAMSSCGTMSGRRPPLFSAASGGRIGSVSSMKRGLSPRLRRTEPPLPPRLANGRDSQDRVGHAGAVTDRVGARRRQLLQDALQVRGAVGVSAGLSSSLTLWQAARQAPTLYPCVNSARLGLVLSRRLRSRR